MEEKVKKAFELANYMSTLAEQKRIIFEEFQQNLIYFFNGATFTVSRELINHVKTLIDLEQTDSVLIDDNNLPVDVQDLVKFLEQILDIHTHATNQFYSKYQKIKKNRSVEGLLDL